ncbi:hypothetical protein [Paeniglutamicibacter psychrophenolicus]|uniref:Uncharacterized protein n=1 Tax=Paeniglutamicibacter psychrophenolicus TaxID=257454 RepID=A0ABS4WJ00_9MICC|nr:hypothetical protein [Paeniglutamicibacter psychrophenolicus]MBP2376184.1 hypothetical protein [Paeniglutamicibacter psychrophenolicus]
MSTTTTSATNRRPARFKLSTASATMLPPSRTVVGKKQVDKAVNDLFQNAKSAQSKKAR